MLTRGWRPRRWAESSDSAPGSAELFALSGELAFDKGQLAQAFQLYRQALKLEPSFRGVHSAIAEIYRLSGHPEWAAAEAALEPRTPPDCTSQPLECQFSAKRFEELAATQPRDTECGVLEGQGSPRVVEAGLRRSCRRCRLRARATRPWRPHTRGARDIGRRRSVEAGAADSPPATAAIERRMALALCHSNDCYSALPLVEGSAEARTLVSRKQLSLRAGARRNPRFRAAHSLIWRTPCDWTPAFVPRTRSARRGLP